MDHPILNLRPDGPGTVGASGNNRSQVLLIFFHLCFYVFSISANLNIQALMRSDPRTCTKVGGKLILHVIKW